MALDYPMDAAQVRDLICEAMTCHCDHGEWSDKGGGLGSADLWLRIGGLEFLVIVKAGAPYRSVPRPRS